MGIVRQFRERIIKALVQAGYQTTGFKKALHDQLLILNKEEWELYEESGDFEEGDEFDPEFCMPPRWANPTAWKRYTEIDEIGREWIIFECAEPATSAQSRSKLQGYGELWFYLDSRDELIALRLVTMDERGGIHPLDLMRVFYDEQRLVTQEERDGGSPGQR